MLTKTKIALSSMLIFGFASAASAQQIVVEPFAGSNGYTDTAPYADSYDEPGVGVTVAPGTTRSRNVVRERDDFTGSAPRSRGSRYSDMPGNQ